MRERLLPAEKPFATQATGPPTSFAGALDSVSVKKSAIVPINLCKKARPAFERHHSGDRWSSGRRISKVGRTFLKISL